MLCWMGLSDGDELCIPRPPPFLIRFFLYCELSEWNYFAVEVSSFTTSFQPCPPHTHSGSAWGSRFYLQPIFLNLKLQKWEVPFSALTMVLFFILKFFFCRLQMQRRLAFRFDGLMFLIAAFNPLCAPIALSASHSPKCALDLCIACQWLKPTFPSDSASLSLYSQCALCIA